MENESWEIKFDDEFPSHISMNAGIKNFIRKTRADLLSQMLLECDRTENEGGRTLVEQFSSRL